MDLEQSRRFATLIAVLIDLKAAVIDEIIDMHDKIMGSLFKYAKNTQVQLLQKSEKSINEQLNLYLTIGSVLLEARETGADVFQAIESVISWEEFSQSIIQTGKLTRKEHSDYMPFIADKYMLVKRYGAVFLEELDIRASPVAGDLIKAIDILRQLYRGKIKKLPEKPPGDFIRKRWEELIFTENGINPKFYELCVFSEIKNCLRSGDISVKGSRQYKDFEDYLIPSGEYSQLVENGQFPLNIPLDAEYYLSSKLKLLSDKLKQVCQLAESDEIPDASLTNARIKVKPMETEIPEEAKELSRKVYRLLPHVKITDLLTEVDRHTGFTDHFTHLKNGEQSTDRALLLTAVLSDAINLGLRKMSEASPGTSYAKLSRIQAWYIRDETYSSALADIVNHLGCQAFSSYWGEGKTSSSDGQRFAVGNHAQGTGRINPKYGSDPGIQFYTHISDQYAPFHTKVINVGVRDATYVLDGLLYHESDLDIEEHYTDTSGFTDHIFALMHLLGFRFAPRIRDLNEKKLFVPAGNSNFSILSEHIGGTVNTKKIMDNWSEILRLAASIKRGAVTASLIIRKIGSYPRQNALATALRELGRIERSLFMLDWYLNPELRRKVTVGLNKGEARNALARAVYFNRLGEVRDRSFESQRYRAGGLNLVTAAIILWNTLYIEKAVGHLRNNGHTINPEYLRYLSPLGWEHIHLTGDYTWNHKEKFKNGELRPLRNLDEM